MRGSLRLTPITLQSTRAHVSILQCWIGEPLLANVRVEVRAEILTAGRPSTMGREDLRRTREKGGEGGREEKRGNVENSIYNFPKFIPVMCYTSVHHNYK